MRRQVTNLKRDNLKKQLEFAKWTERSGLEVDSKFAIIRVKPRYFYSCAFQIPFAFAARAGPLLSAAGLLLVAFSDLTCPAGPSFGLITRFLKPFYLLLTREYFKEIK